MRNFSVRSKYSLRSVSLCVFLPLLFLPVVLTGQTAQEIVVPLKNWAAPLYWQPNQVERAEENPPGNDAETPVFGESGVHERSHFRGGHALPPGGYSRRPCWI